MNQKIKKKVLSWMNEQIKEGQRTFDMIVCVSDIGLDPFDNIDLEQVEEIFEWHKNLVNTLLFEGIDDNT
jgi:hypothetical protein